MNYQTIETGSTPEIRVSEVVGSLYVKSWERPEVFVKADPEEVQVEKLDSGLKLSCQGDLVLQVPVGAQLTVTTVRGDAQFKNLEGSLVIETVNGSLDIKNVADVQATDVFGDCRAKRIDGKLAIQRVMGSLYGRGLEGDCTLEQVMGDLTLRDAAGNIQAQAKGQVRLQLNSLDGNIDAQANGDLHCALRGEVDANLDITSGAGSIRINIPGLNELVQDNHYTAKTGSGSYTLKLNAAGEVFVLGRSSAAEEGEEFNLEFEQELNQQISQQVEVQMQNMLKQFDEQVRRISDSVGSGKLSAEQTERIMERAREQSERAAVRAQEKLRQVQEKMERRAEAQRQRQETRGQSRGRGKIVLGKRSWEFDFSPTGAGAQVNKEVSDEERLMILRMLEQKKISLEEAEQLLSSLEGKN